MNPNQKTPDAKTTPEAPVAKFAVVKEFWLGDKCCAAGSTVELTDSQAKRLGDSVKAA
jgi:hypothetical protein